MATVFLRLLAHDDKPTALARAVDRLRDGEASPDVHVVDPESFRQVPGSPFAYWVSEKVLTLWSKLKPLKDSQVTICSTNPLNEDFRYFRLSWEAAPEAIGINKGLVNLAKGGDFSRYYSDIHLMALWDVKEETYQGFTGTVNRPMKRPASVDWFFVDGLTYSRRSQVGFSVRVLPRQTIFHDKGPGIFPTSSNRAALLGLMNSHSFQCFLDMQISFGSYEVGIVQSTPIPDVDNSLGDKLGLLAIQCVNIKRDLDRSNETSHVFHLPRLLQVPGETLANRIAVRQTRDADADRQLAENQREIDDIAFRLYGIDGEDRRAMEEGAGLKIEPAEDVEAEDDEAEDDAGPAVEGKPPAAALLSYATGCVVGRWDLRFATGERPTPELPDPFDPLPVCSPGMLQGDDGLPLQHTPEGYPLVIDWDGILVDDPDHFDDIIRRVRDVLEVIWKDRADAIETEACEILGVAELRDYYRKPGAGGFWDDHVKRYSKSRRKAPIYWLLQSSRKNYGLWVYYHRLDKDILFKALLNYVEPKVRLEENRLQPLRAQRAEAGTAGKGVKAMEKQVEKQEALLSELRDFEAKLRRAANLHLEPDLNDGVVLNIAPLWELVPWKEAKAYWDELLAGKYEWSSIGKQLRAKGLVE